MNAREMLKTYSGKRFVYLVDRGNTAIKKALEIAKANGKHKVIIPAEGGWLTYKQYPQELGMRLVEVKTRNGVIDLSYLKEELAKDAVLLVNSMPAYSTYEQMELLCDVCARYGTMVINDASGSIGSVHARYGDIVICSFGKWKPIEMGTGGFIASNEILSIEESELDELELSKAIRARPDRTQYWSSAVKKIKSDLKDMRVVHEDSNGYVAIIKFKNDTEKHLIIKYCEDNKWEYTECPRHIRLQQPAISIEVKRKNG